MLPNFKGQLLALKRHGLESFSRFAHLWAKLLALLKTGLVYNQLALILDKSSFTKASSVCMTTAITKKIFMLKRMFILAFQKEGEDEQHDLINAKRHCCNVGVDDACVLRRQSSVVLA